MSRDSIINQFIPKVSMTPGAGAAISAGAGLLGGLFNKIGAKRRYKRQVRDQKKMLDYQYEQNLAQWNRENEYNSPEATMARLKEAGLNPHLVYGTGTQGNTAASSPDYEAGSVQKQDQTNFDLGQLTQNSLGAFTDTRLKNAQVDNVRAATQGQKIKNGFEDIERLIKKHEAEKKGIDVKQSQAEFDNYEKYQSSFLDQRNKIQSEQLKLRIFENEWKERPEYKKDRAKWEAKRGKAENAVEFMETMMERYPDLQKSILEKVDRLMSILGY